MGKLPADWLEALSSFGCSPLDRRPWACATYRFYVGWFTSGNCPESDIAQLYSFDTHAKHLRAINTLLVPCGEQRINKWELIMAAKRSGPARTGLSRFTPRIMRRICGFLFAGRNCCWRCRIARKLTCLRPPGQQNHEQQTQDKGVQTYPPKKKRKLG